MSEYTVSLKWISESNDFSYKNYSRTHELKFGGGIVVKASAAPEYLGKPEYVNPEEAFIASLASCHMLTFLAIASYKKYSIKSYEGNAVGIVGKNDSNKMAVLKVILRPVVEFDEANKPSEDDLNKMHEKAHAECFISNSVLTAVTIELKK
ncbi:MAG: OsmC family protein [Flammeovirgaceae bacterium]|nr:OsmC family protein [Flammeovirgaceae bacterium]